MAQVFNRIATFSNGLVIGEVKFNDQNLGILSSRITNNSDFPAHLDAVLDPPINGTSTSSADCPAHQTVEQNFPNNVLKYTRDADGNLSLVGISLFCRWPA